LKDEGFLLKLKNDAKLIENSIKAISISGDGKTSKSSLDSSK